MKRIRITLVDDSDQKGIPYSNFKDYEVADNLSDKEIEQQVKAIISKAKKGNTDYYNDDDLFISFIDKLGFKEIDIDIKEFKFDF